MRRILVEVGGFNGIGVAVYLYRVGFLFLFLLVGTSKRLCVRFTRPISLRGGA